VTIARPAGHESRRVREWLLLFDRSGQITAFEEKPNASGSRDDRAQPSFRIHLCRHSAERPFVASMGIYVFSREVLLEILEQGGAKDFGREAIQRPLTATA